MILGYMKVSAKFSRVTTHTVEQLDNFDVLLKPWPFFLGALHVVTYVVPAWLELDDKSVNLRCSVVHIVQHSDRCCCVRVDATCLCPHALSDFFVEPDLFEGLCCSVSEEVLSPSSSSSWSNVYSISADPLRSKRQKNTLVTQ